MINTKTQAQLTIIKAAQDILEQKPIFIDTETTGLDKDAEIIEISIVDHDGAILYTNLFRPSRPIPVEASRVNHITDSMVQDKKTWAASWMEVRSFIYGRLIGMYNADFDLRMMQQSHQRYGLAWKESLRIFDVMKLFAQFRGEIDPRRNGYKYFPLETAGKISGISIPNSHRASDDTLLTRALLYHIAGKDWRLTDQT